MGDARQTRIVDRRRHLRPRQIDRGDERRIEIRIDGVLERRQEQPYTVGAHLVNVVDDFGKPLFVQHARDETRLHLRQHEPVAVVVVPDVLVVQPWQRATLIASALVAAIPADNRIETIGIHRRDHQHDDRIEEHAQIGIGDEPISERHAHLARCDFGRVNVVADQHHRRLRTPEAREDRVAQAPRIGEQRLRALDLCQPRLIGGRCNHHEQERAPFRRAPQRIDTHVAAALRQRVHVSADLLPIGEQGIGAGLETKNVGWAVGRLGGL